MNKNLHRIVFNKSRGERMVVAETAASQGKGREGPSATGTSPLHSASTSLLSSHLPSISQTCLSALLLITPAFTPATAQIKADPSAPGQHRPVILAAPNGVPVVNITTPSAAGISRNVYSQMDVARPGAILNNSRTNVQSQLGGILQGNPFLATGSAKAILNEVNSSNPTLLKGPIEVAGQRADVIISNPSGIKVDGTTFINASNVVLTTGTPVLDGRGSLESYRVIKGTFSVEGLGLDTRTATATEIYARAVEINAGLWANYLKMTTGANAINPADPSNPTAITPPADIPKPRFALDVGAIGGMYSGHIFLVGNEYGLGVNHGGTIDASDGELVLLANGWITNKGALRAQGNLHVNGASGISNSGTMAAAGNTTITTQGSITNEGAQARIASQNNVVLIAGAGSAGGINNTQGASVTAAGALSATTGGALHNPGGTLAANAAVTLDAASVHNTGGTIASVQSNVNIATPGTIINTDGAISAGSAANLSASQLNNAGGYIGATNKLSLNVTLGEVNNTQGLIESADTLTLQAGQLRNEQGLIHSANSLTVIAASVHNDAGRISSAGSVAITADTVNNSHTARVGQGIEAGDIAITASTVANDTGAIRASNDASIASSTTVTNTSGLLSAGKALEVSGADLSISNTGGTLIAGERATVDAASLSGPGSLLSHGDVNLNLTGNHTHTGEITALGNAGITVAGDLTNTSLLQAGNNLTVSATNLSNTSSGEITSGATTALHVPGTLTNRGLIDGTCTQVNAGDLQNIGTGRIYGNHVSIQAGTVTNAAETVSGLTSAGVNAARERLDMGAAHISNRDHALIFSAGDMALGGALDANRKAVGEATSVTNASASIEALGKLSITTASLTNLNQSFTSTLQPGATVQVIDHAEPGGAYLPASEVRLCDENGCVAGSDLAWLSKATRQLLLPSAEFPFESFAAYYSAFPAASRDVYDPSCYHPGIGGGDHGGICGLHIPGRWYESSDPIWSAFGVIPHSAPEPPLSPANGCQQLARNHQACTAGAIGYYDITDPNQPFIVFPAPITQAQVNEWQLWDAWSHPYQAAHEALDARLADFSASIASRLRENWTYRSYSQIQNIPVLTSSDPAVISAGGDITLAVSSSATNAMSRITAGGALNVTGVAVHNAGAEAVAQTIQTGSAVHTYKAACGGVFALCSDNERKHDAQPYSATIEQNVTLAAAITQGNTGASPARTSIAAPGTVSPIVQVSVPASVDGGQGAHIRTAAASALASSSLFRPTPNPQAGYLIETDPRFTNYATWLSSDYMLDALGIMPNETNKRLGDGFYEQRLVREQVAQLTGQRFLGDYTSDDEQFRALMESGATLAKQWNLRPGIALAATQMAQLTSDIVWLVEQEVTLPDGRTVKALVPQVYARVRDGDLSPGGALLAGLDVNIDLSGDMMNSGTVLGRRLLSLNARNVQNLAGSISGDAVNVKAQEDINVIGGTITAVSSLIADAGREVNVQSTVRTTDTTGGDSTASRTVIDRVAGLYVTGDKGLLVAAAGRDANIVAGVMANSGKDGATIIQAARDINLATVETKSSDTTTWNAKNHRSESNSSDIGSVIQGTGSVELNAGNDINAKAATVNAGGAVLAKAGRDVTVEAGTSNQAVDEAHHRSSRGFLSSQSSTSKDKTSSTHSVASSLSGETVTVLSGRDIQVTGSAIVSDTGTTLIGGRNVTIVEATETQSESRLRSEKESGLFGSGTSVTLGSRQQSSDADGTSTTAAASNIGAIIGNVTIRAGGLYTQRGSDVIAPGGDVDIVAKDNRITEARETSASQSEHKSSQSGLSVGVSGPVISALQTIAAQSTAAGNTKNSRMQGLAAANSALAAKNAFDALKAGQGTEFAGKSHQMVSEDAAGNMTSRDATAAEQMGGMNLSISIGGSSSQSKRASQSDTARGSSIQAGGNVSIRSTGAGEASNVVIQGSTVKAGTAVTLDADNKVQLLAATNTASQTSSDKSSSGSIGISIGTSGFGVTASASAGRGNADGSDVTHTNTRIEGNRVSIKSGGDTDIKGAVVKADTVTAKMGGNLNIESLQDTSTYKERSRSAGGSVTVGAGASGSFSASSSNIDSHYASVLEQSGIRAGDGGFQVEVQGRTDLKGGAITSTQAAIDQGRNEFESKGGVTTSDIENTANYSAKSTSIGTSLGSGNSPSGQSIPGGGFGAGKDGGKASSTTQSAISGIAGNKNARTGDAETGIKPIFDPQKVKDEVNAQVAITAEFGKQAPKAWADYSKGKLDDLKEQTREAARAGDTQKAKELFDEAKKWDEGGEYRVAGHTVLGALAGGASGAAGALTSSAAMPAIGAAIDGTDLPVMVKQGLGMVASATLGGIVGGTAGAATSFNVDTNNRQLHPTEEKWLRDKAREFAKKEGISEQQAMERLTQQALKEVDYLWRAQLNDGDDVRAEAFLQSASDTFTNQLGEQQKLFTAPGQQLFRPEMFADTANPAFYRQFAQSGITRDLTTGLMKEFKDSGIDVKNSAAELAEAVKNNPGAALEGVWKAVQGLPQGVVDSFKETGTAIGEGSAVVLSKELTDKLNAIYGTDTAGVQKALLAIRVTAALTGATGAAKAGTELTEATANVVGKKLDEVLDASALEALMRSGGVVDQDGHALLDMRRLTANQKGVIGDLFGANIVKQIVPDGQKLARIPSIGETGIDDLYKVNRPGVDYVVIEYKFVGPDSKTGAQALSTTLDGPQGSQSWIEGGRRIEKAVSSEVEARAVRRALDSGRVESWVVTTRPDGSTIVQVLDSAGKPKLIDTSRIIVPSANFSGAKP